MDAIQKTEVIRDSSNEPTKSDSDSSFNMDLDMDMDEDVKQSDSRGNYTF